MSATSGSTALGDDARDLAEPRMLAQALQVQWQLAPPVRMLVDGARNVCLIAHIEHILERDREQPRGRRGEITDDGGKVAGRKPPAPQRRVQRSDRGGALAGSGGFAAISRGRILSTGRWPAVRGAQGCRKPR